jgi:GNAT superfamily N-acetyltransferase
METERPRLCTYYLEMRDPADLRATASPAEFRVSRVTPPEPALNARFYREVGALWDWTDRLPWTGDDWRRYVEREPLETWVGWLAGSEVGYFELEAQAEGNTKLAYFGLLPQFIGQGLGGPLLTAAIRCAWAVPGTQRVWVHTCTWDHQHALGNYRKRGLKLYRTECE